MLYYILKDKRGAYREIQEEIDQVVGSVPSKDAADLTTEHLDRLVCLGSVFQEVGRMQFGGFTVRDVTENFVYETNMKGQPEGKPSKFLIRKGSRIMAYAGVQHYDDVIFEEPEEFQWDRFAKKDGTKPQFFDKNGRRVVSPTLQFGMGTNLCPGRRFIEYENKAYLAMLLSRFEVRLCSEELSKETPGPDKLSHGISMNSPDREVHIELRPRSVHC